MQNHIDVSLLDRIPSKDLLSNIETNSEDMKSSLLLWSKSSGKIVISEVFENHMFPNEVKYDFGNMTKQDGNQWSFVTMKEYEEYKEKHIALFDHIQKLDNELQQQGGKRRRTMKKKRSKRLRSKSRKMK
jgi:hypothetical protein